MTKHDSTSCAAGDQDSQSGLQGPQSLWPCFIWHDSPGEYGGARIHLKHHLNLNQQAEITLIEQAQLRKLNSTQGAQLNWKSLTKLHSEYLSLTLIVIMYNLSYTFPIFRTSCQSSWRWTLCPPLAPVAWWPGRSGPASPSSGRGASLNSTQGEVNSHYLK